jgi:hypothetical protein
MKNWYIANLVILLIVIAGYMAKRPAVPPSATRTFLMSDKEIRQFSEDLQRKRAIDMAAENVRHPKPSIQYPRANLQSQVSDLEGRIKELEAEQ